MKIGTRQVSVRGLIEYTGEIKVGRVCFDKDSRKRRSSTHYLEVENVLYRYMSDP